MGYNVTILIIALVLLLVIAIAIAKLIKYLSEKDKGYMDVAVKLGPFSINVKTGGEDRNENKN